MVDDLHRAYDGEIMFDADKYVNRWPAKKHDHFLIPAGTPHCSGRNSMVLEISATPYIFTFKMWDWGRLGLDGIPRPIHLEHGLRNIQWDRTTAWVEKNLVNRITEVARGDGWVEERTGLHEREFIETRRHWFTGSVPHCTNGGVNVLNLCEGREAIVGESDRRLPAVRRSLCGDVYRAGGCRRVHHPAAWRVRRENSALPSRLSFAPNHRTAIEERMKNPESYRPALSSVQLASPACVGSEPLAHGEGGCHLASKYLVFPDVTYGTANNYQMKLDVWQRADQKTPVPTVIYIHGGGWIFGDRTGATLWFLPYLEMGWNVINVEYRMADVSLAPAAVEDTRCALRWAVRNAKQYNIDVNKIVLTGHSAGGHLSLITGMLPEGTGLDNNCYPDEKWGDVKIKVAAIVNWYGISDVNDLIQGPNLKNYAMMWMGSQTDAAAIAKRVSPLTYVRPGLAADILRARRP